jgi:hypothetical protein
MIMSRKEQPTLGEMIDQLYAVRQERLELEAEAEALKKQQTAMEEYLIDEFSTEDLEGAAGRVGKISVTPVIAANIDDPANWNAFFEWCAKHDAWDMLYHRVNQKAVMERWEARVKIPHLTRFEKKKISISKK